MYDAILDALRRLLGEGFAYDCAMQARPVKWDVCEKKLDDGPPDGDGWEPFAACMTTGGTTWIQWRKPA